ncbi:MFS transporter [Actinocatenispora rupis]|uniref:MFS transporter n=1 Tax=Actinocatenispora rupis TaxID=519421 RepID=A0A8J3J5N3_9ACTN|nr:MFS transporter [Actinocatenispora rupis]GID10587.1 MFS transporter [Actinocatenispora rupis]
MELSRTRSLVALFAGAAAVNAATVTASTASALLTADTLGAGWSGLPGAASVAGTAAGVAVLSRLMARWGRRTGLLAGAATGTVGAAVATVAAATATVPLLVVGMVLLGSGNAAAQLARYAGADLYPPARRGFALGAVVWAGTVGAAGGPLLLAPVTRLAGATGWPPLAGAFGFALLCVGAAAATLTLVVRRPAPEPETGVRQPIRPLLGHPTVRLALAAMATAQVVMVAIMTAAPVDMHEHGQPMSMVGLVLSTHTLGMFALAPLSGKLADLIGGRSVIALGLGVLALSAVLVVTTVRTGVPGLPVALFALGYGWNLAFVGGSTLLVRGLPAAAEARVQGVVETISWSAGAAATLASTAVLSVTGYPPLAAAAGALVLLPAVLLVVPPRGPGHPDRRDADEQVTDPAPDPEVPAVDRAGHRGGRPGPST